MGLQRGLYRYRFGPAAFLIPLGVRAIPEIIVGPYPVGWDTIAFYEVPRVGMLLKERLFLPLGRMSIRWGPL